MRHTVCGWLTSQSTIFQSCRDGAIASWVINQYFRGVKCLAQGHNTAAVILFVGWGLHYHCVAHLGTEKRDIDVYKTSRICDLQ